MSSSELRDAIRTIKEVIEPLKDVQKNVVAAYSASGQLKSSVDKLFEIVVTGDARPPLLTQLAELREKFITLSGEISTLTSGLSSIKNMIDAEKAKALEKIEEHQKEIKSTRVALIIVVISAVIGPIIVALIVAFLLG